MLYFDYTWDLTPTTIAPDKELNTDRLGWVHGDIWQVVELNGNKILVKMTKTEKGDNNG